MQFERKTQEEVEESLEHAISIIEQDPTLIRLMNFKRMIETYNHLGYDVGRYKDMYNGLWLLYAKDKETIH